MEESSYRAVKRYEEGFGETANFESLCRRGDRSQGKCRSCGGDTGFVESPTLVREREVKREV